MSTERKIRASQLNGAKSHGPVTPAGRLKSSANSARHYLLSKTILLENERPDAFADLLAGLTSEFNPQTETQRALVETMAVSRWRQTRIWAVERATLQSAMEAVDPDTVEPATRAALAFCSLADDSRTLDLLNRYETRFDRQFARSLNLLMKLASPDNPLRRTGLPACPSAEGAPFPAQTDFCQTNLIPFPDTQSEPSSEPPEALESVPDLPPATPAKNEQPAAEASRLPANLPIPLPTAVPESPTQTALHRSSDSRDVSGAFFSSLNDKENRPAINGQAYIAAALSRAE